MAAEVAFQELHPAMDNRLKGYKQRDLSQTRFFKAACRTFGPPKSRTRRIIAPPMEKLQSGTAEVTEPSFVDSGSIIKWGSDTVAEIGEASNTGQSISDWIRERQKFRTQVDGMGDVEKWLRGKPDLTDLETRVQDRMEERNLKSRMSLQTTQETVYKPKEGGRTLTRSTQSRGITPTIQQPSPGALAILEGYLNQRRLRLVDIYNQTDKSKRKQISSHDLKTVRKEANIPISDVQFDDLVISLSGKQPNQINYKELSAGRRSWRKKNMEERRNGVAVSPATARCFQPPSDHDTEGDDSQPAATLSGMPDGLGSAKTESRPVRSVQSGGSGSQYLQVPPVSLEERRPLSYEDMEDIGKNYRERKRRVKSNTRLLDWLEQCRLVRTGDAAVDAHSLPSTLGGETAELVEQFRRQGLQQYYKILGLCQAHEVPLTEQLLEGALLHPGDKLITCGPGQQLPLRQPGTGTVSKDKFKRKSHVSGSESQESGRWTLGQPGTAMRPKDRVMRESNVSANGHQETGKMQVERSPGTGDGPYPPETYVRWVRTKVRGKKRVKRETLRCWTTYEQFQGMIGNLKRRFPHSFFTSDDNAFWPGHLAEKLRIYLPKAAEKDTNPLLTRSQTNRRG
ncbi:EF-hand calcium-binding domain-containing protein 12 [Pseudophryne corroboree]|uniref:EF-hand calcium-binding domain-containing protein 12 n=1 Tax=Pseudophryne corroboree TaxID=495146 RepID=UPI0030816926